MAGAFAMAGLAACRRSTAMGLPSDAVRVEVTAVGFDQQAGMPFVQLDDHDGNRSIQITIGSEEARTINLELKGIKTIRPMTSELLGKVISHTGNAVDRVTVTEVRDEIYYAKIMLNHGRYAIDSRPSDAIALALAVRAPIYVARALMRSNLANASDVPAPVTSSNLGFTVQQLTPDLAQYFGVEMGSGVVVADPGAQGAVGLQRGDIIVEVGGQAVRTPADFLRASRTGQKPGTLAVRRGHATSIITIAPAAASSVAK
jgi:bifunctional DNase/RNase